MLVNVYLLASPKDSAHREELEKQLAPHRDLISYWSSDHILVGEDIDPEVERQLVRAQIAVWLISPDFRSMEEQGVEARCALALERTGRLRILPVLVRVTTHYRAPYAGRPVFPDNKIPVSNWNDRDAAWRNVVAGIRKAAQEIAGVPQQGYAAVPSMQTGVPLSTGDGRASGPVSAGRVSMPVGAAAENGSLRVSSPPMSGSPPVSAPPVSAPPRVSAPPSPRNFAYLPPDVREQQPSHPPAPEERRAVAPAPPRSKSRWVIGLLVLASIAVLFAAGPSYFGLGSKEDGGADSGQRGAPSATAGGARTTMTGGAPSPTTGGAPSTTTSGASSPTTGGTTAGGACCGGLDCPKESLQADDTNCAKGDYCRPCLSGRRYVSGACGSALPAANIYKLRLGGLTTPGYAWRGTDRMCVQPAGGSPVCAGVTEAQFGPLLGTVQVGDLTGPLGVDVWFDRGGARVATFPGMRPPRARLSNVVLCTGASLYSADGKSIVRFYLDP